MDFTRKIPGIRLPVPGRRDSAGQAVEPWPTGLVDAWVYTFLIVVPLGIFLLCTLEYDGSLGVLWLEPYVMGLTLFAIATIINVLLMLMLLGELLLSGAWRSRLKWKRGLAYLVALGLLGGAQTYLNGWRGAAEHTLTVALEREQGFQDQLALIEAELRTLGSEGWPGEYSGRSHGGELTCWFAPKSGFGYAWYGDAYSSAARPASRLAHSRFHFGGIGVMNGTVRVDGDSSGRALWGYKFMPWNGRRYLVPPHLVSLFDELVWADEATEAEILSEAGVLVRPDAD